MKKVLIVRHGEYRDSDGSLNQEGKQQIHKLIKLIRERYEANNPSMCVLSSSLRRVQETANLIAEGFDCGAPSIVPGLDENNLHTDEFKKGVDIIQESSKDVDILLVVVQSGAAVAIPNALVSREVIRWQRFNELDKGEACVLDLEERKFEGTLTAYGFRLH